GRIPYRSTLLEKKRLISGRHLAGDIDNLARYLIKISVHDRYGRDITPYGLKRALVEVMAHFSVYRTYVNGDSRRSEDPDLIRRAVTETLRENRGMRYEVRFIERYLLKAFDSSLPASEREAAVGFVMRFQQLTGPLMAKAVEDTLFYVYNRFISLNEVGGEADRFGVTADRFHDFNRRKLATFPHSLSASSTHDTKRGEDVRARLNVLSEIPREWKAAVRVWQRLNLKRKREVDGVPAPDANDEYFLYQTLMGAFPFDLGEIGNFAGRIREHVVKAAREAKVHTDWLNPDEDYETACKSFVDEILKDSEDNPFLQSFSPLQRKVAHFGMVNSLSQTLLKITAPGVPDFYQGSELWDLRLVDPDNRTPVDFGRRFALLESLRQSSASPADLIAELMENKEDGRLKLHLIRRALHARRDHQELFAFGDYVPLKVAGKCGRHLLAFARKRGHSWAVTIAPRLCVALMKGKMAFPLGAGVWEDTVVTLPEGAPRHWEEALTGTRLECRRKIVVGRALELFPAALLLATEERI
ncbi:MAG: malto-oligosyltrehalose synthase, partial [Desulfuromonadaceae bacterium]|nr:malto-oligosyltrehalose synthase [Desulfuromonadaceae bacterium]